MYFFATFLHLKSVSHKHTPHTQHFVKCAHVKITNFHLSFPTNYAKIFLLPNY